jgi:hypothetical protein
MFASVLFLHASIGAARAAGGRPRRAESGFSAFGGHPALGAAAQTKNSREHKKSN